jgi:hypothetical protein
VFAWGQRQKEGLQTTIKKAFGSDRNVHFLDFHDVFIGAQYVKMY